MSERWLAAIPMRNERSKIIEREDERPAIPCASGPIRPKIQSDPAAYFSGPCSLEIDGALSAIGS
jgi:hypothetical protein